MRGIAEWVGDAVRHIAAGMHRTQSVVGSRQASHNHYAPDLDSKKIVSLSSPREPFGSRFADFARAVRGRSDMPRVAGWFSSTHTALVDRG